MTNKYMKRYSTSVAIKKIKKPPMRYHYTNSRLEKENKLDNTKY